MRTVGVDLSAEARRTGIAVIDWEAGDGRLLEVRVGADDELLLAALNDTDRAAIDCPLGWPEPFVHFLMAHQAGRAPAPVGQSGLEWRRTLSRRATDLHVAEVVRAACPSRWGRTGSLRSPCEPPGYSQLSRTRGCRSIAGAGLLVEVYPAAALKIWGLTSRSYKGTGNRAALGLLVDDLQTALPNLDWSGYDTVCRHSDDALDAVVCALIARSAHLGLTTGPPDHLSALASTEGWIHLPNGRGSLAGLTE